MAREIVGFPRSGRKQKKKDRLNSGEATLLEHVGGAANELRHTRALLDRSSIYRNKLAYCLSTGKTEMSGMNRRWLHGVDD